jgi:hypothetical protein
MASQNALVRIHIAGRWSADDFSQLLRTSNDIYNLSIILSADLLRSHALRDEMFPMDRRKVRKLAARVAPRPWLDVTKISYASPGSIDLLGLAAVVGHVKDFSLGLLDRYQSRDFRKLELKEKQRLAAKAVFDDELERSNKLALVRHAENELTLKTELGRLKVQKRSLENRALDLANMDAEGTFAIKIVQMARENDLTRSQIEKIGTWLDSRAAPVRELAELNQILEVETVKQ